MNLISNIKEYTVSELNSSIKNIMENNFNLIKFNRENMTALFQNVHKKIY